MLRCVREYLFDFFSRNLFFTLIFCVSAFLLLKGLGDRPLWCDEAMTANVARHISESGIPRGWDGVNLITLPEDIDGNFLETLHPWLPYYLVFLSFKIFGENNFAARLPFAFFGLASLFLFYCFAKKIIGQKGANVSSVLLGFSINFLLYSRNCRYYSLTIFGGLLLLWAYFKLANGKIFDLVLFVIAGAFLFHSHYVVFIVFYPSLIISSLLLDRRNKVFPLSVATVGILLLTVPWYLLTDRIPLQAFHAETFLSDTAGMFWGNLKCSLFYGFYSLILVPLFFISHLFKFDTEYWPQNKKYAAFFAIFILVFFVILSIVMSYAYPNMGGLCQIRSMMILLPCFILLMTVGFLSVSGFSKSLMWILIAIYIFTNIFSWPLRPNLSGSKLFRNSYLYGYVHELFYPRKNAIDDMAAYLKKNADSDDIIFAEKCWAYQLIWQLNKSCKFCCVIDPKSVDFRGKLQSLPKHNYSTFTSPDWILYSRAYYDANLEPYMSETLANINQSNYYPLIDFGNTRFYSGRPEIEEFMWLDRPFFEDLEKVQIFKRKGAQKLRRK